MKKDCPACEAGIAHGRIAMAKVEGKDVTVHLSSKAVAAIEESLKLDYKVGYYIDTTPFSSNRLMVRFTDQMMHMDYEQQFLNDMCLWGGADKRTDYDGGSVMLSWEFNIITFNDVILPVLERWGHKRGWALVHHSKVWT